jgi:hypothetical protein
MRIDPMNKLDLMSLSMYTENPTNQEPMRTLGLKAANRSFRFLQWSSADSTYDVAMVLLGCYSAVTVVLRWCYSRPPGPSSAHPQTAPGVSDHGDHARNDDGDHGMMVMVVKMIVMMTVVCKGVYRASH